MLDKLRVLVIDDSDVAREMMVRALTEAGMHATPLSSPIGATRAILQNNITVVVIDLLMPGMRGDRLATLFRGNPRFNQLGVVMVSGESEVELKRLAAEARADAVVSKANLRELAPAVRRVAMLGSKRA